VAISDREHGSVAGLKIESPCSGASSERSSSPMSRDDVKPFIITVPVELPQTVWFDVYVRDGSPRFFEVSGGILDLYPTTRGDYLLLLGQAEDIRIRNVSVRGFLGLFVSVTFLRRRNCALENVGICGGNLLKIGDAETKILRDNLEWGVDEPVGKHKGGTGGIKVTVGKD